MKSELCKHWQLLQITLELVWAQVNPPNLKRWAHESALFQAAYVPLILRILSLPFEKLNVMLYT